MKELGYEDNSVGGQLAPGGLPGALTCFSRAVEERLWGIAAHINYLRLFYAIKLAIKPKVRPFPPGLTYLRYVNGLLAQEIDRSLSLATDELLARCRSLTPSLYQDWLASRPESPNSLSRPLAEQAVISYPHLTRLAPESYWRSQGRRIKKGAEPYLIEAGNKSGQEGEIIVRQGFLSGPAMKASSAPLFDGGDTEAIEPLSPKEQDRAARLIALAGEACSWLDVRLFLEGCDDDPIGRFAAADLLANQNMAGVSVLAQHGADHIQYIAVPSGHSPSQLAHILCHELGHVWLGHSRNQIEGFEHDICEAQAEIFAFLICFGSDVESPHSHFYLYNHLEWCLEDGGLDRLIEDGVRTIAEAISLMLSGFSD